MCCAEDALAAGVGRYDLLLLDVMMPGMSGFELARRLKGDEQTAHIAGILTIGTVHERASIDAGNFLGYADRIMNPRLTKVSNP